MRNFPPLATLAAGVMAALPLSDVERRCTEELGSFRVEFYAAVPTSKQVEAQPLNDQQKRLEAVLKPMAQPYGFGEFFVQLIPDKDHVVIVVTAKPNKTSRLWNAVNPKKFNADDKNSIISGTDEKHMVYLVPRSALHPEKFLRDGAEKLPWMHPVYRIDGELQVPLGTFFVKLKNGANADDIGAFVQKKHLRIVRREGMILTLALTDASPYPTVFAASAAVMDQKFTQQSEPDFASAVKTK
ncbi:MAG TPA: hypothetical protein VI873_00855 [Candidatus Peribacteraceae bacterium]|nr:hypothetical protein [Candidatus Peribacteraceae bacterium]